MNTATLNPDLDRKLAGVSFGPVVHKNAGTVGAVHIATHHESEEVFEEETSGLDGIVDWDYLEERLYEGSFASKQQFQNTVRKMFLDAGEPLPTRAMLDAVVDGMGNLPADTLFSLENVHQWRAIHCRRTYDALPARGFVSKLQVKEVRERIAAGQKRVEISRAMGIGAKTVSEIATGRVYAEAVA